MLLLILFVSAFHQTGLDTRSMTRRLIIAGFEKGGGRAQAETQTLLDYAGHHRPAEGVCFDVLKIYLPITGTRLFSWVIWYSCQMEYH